jgi:glucose-1-phosphate cytidylyltransferase
MKVIILAGGYGTRISEETYEKPKPMVLIDSKPLLWHLMGVFANQGFDDFIIATGYKGEVIRDWALSIEENWKVQVLDTGQDTQTGGRIKRCIQECSDELFFATYGDGLADVDLVKLLDQHNNSNALLTLTAVRPPARFGYLKLDGVQVRHFGEKNQTDEGWINGGFFVLNRNVLEYIPNEIEPFEIRGLPDLARVGLLNAYLHEGFWQPMDTLREKLELEKYAKLKPPPWKRYP